MTIAGIVVFLMLCGMFWARNCEKREWNDGICAKNGLPWVRFDTDSQGGRGYRSGKDYGNPRTAYYCWISYGVDK